MLYPDGDPDKFGDHVFRAFDTDGNGYIDFKEFMLAIYATSGSTIEDKIRFVFRIYDIDMNGEIDLAEMEKIFSVIYDIVDLPSEQSRSAAREVFDTIDANKDGILSEQEFLTACTKREELFNLLTQHQ